jgi:hypothetical protein
MSDVIRTITWAELGSPAEPSSVTAQGMTLKVEDRHIQAANGEPYATFNVLEFQPKSGSAQYVLGLRVD